jgi:hypothetical protein
MTDFGQPTARATLAQLLEVIQATVESVLGEPQQYKADARAGIWIREEIDPLLKTLTAMADANSKAAKCSCRPQQRGLVVAAIRMGDPPTPDSVVRPIQTDEDCPQHGTLTLAEKLPLPCPLCDEGEELTTYPKTFHRPLGASFSCGHWIEFPATTGLGLGTADRAVLPLNSMGMVLPGQSVQIVMRPQLGPFRPQRIVIGGANPAVWLIEDIRVGNRSQMPQGQGPLSGALFGPQGVDGQPVEIDFEVVQTAMDFAMTVRYVGDTPDGQEFRAAVIGIAAR